LGLAENEIGDVEAGYLADALKTNTVILFAS